MCALSSLRSRLISVLNKKILILSLYRRRRKIRAKRKRRWWVRPINQRRIAQGANHNLVEELSQDEDKFYQYFRTSREQFAQILHYVEKDLIKIHNSRETVTPRERLAVALSYLATGESYSSLGFQFRLGVTTISQIIPEICDAIWKGMTPFFMRAPECADDWKLISVNFWQKCQFPFCLGAIDGKHVVMMKPWKSGSLFYNYKGFEHIGEVPYVAVADEAFPLLQNLLRPFPGRENTWNKQVFNYRLSRDRRLVEKVALG